MYTSATSQQLIQSTVTDIHKQGTRSTADPQGYSEGGKIKPISAQELLLAYVCSHRLSGLGYHE